MTMIMTMTAMTKKKDKMMINLVDFLPALEVLGSDESMVVKQSLSHNRVGRVDHRVVNRGQALPVPIIWTAQDNSKEGVGGNKRK